MPIKINTKNRETSTSIFVACQKLHYKKNTDRQRSPNVVDRKADSYL